MVSRVFSENIHQPVKIKCKLGTEYWVVVGFWSAAIPLYVFENVPNVHITSQPMSREDFIHSLSNVELNLASGHVWKAYQFILFAFETTSNWWLICRLSINNNSLMNSDKFQHFLLNEMEKRCLYGAVMMHAAVSSLPYRRDVSFNMLQSCGPIRSDVAPGEWSLHGWRGWRRGGKRSGCGSGCVVFLPFLSSSRQQAPAKWLWVPPTVKLIELVIRGVETSIRPEEASVHPRLH